MAAGQTERPVVSSSPSAIFMLCTAAPEAPLPRLSSRAVSQNWSAAALAKTKSSTQSAPASAEASSIIAAVSGSPSRAAPIRTNFVSA